MYQVLNRPNEIVVAYDIETCVRPDARTHLEQSDCGFDKRLKDPAKIEESRKEKRQEAIEKAPLYWWHGQIVSVACEEVLTGNKFSICTLDEKKLLTSLFDYLSNLSTTDTNMEVALVGKNSAGFDRGYIVGRCIALNIGVPSFMKKTWGTIDDIDQFFGGKLSSQCGKLADYAFGIGMEKGGHGSEVAEMVIGQRWDEIVTYNEQDTRITAEIIKRYMKVWRA
jgi:hypothetical protein